MARKGEKKASSAPVPQKKKRKIGVPITKKNAAEMGRMGGKKKAENFWAEKDTAKLFKGILNAPVKVSEEFAAFAFEFGLKVPGEIAFKGALYLKAAWKAYENGDYKACVELLKMAGEHFDQSKEALGGANNPLNVSQSMSLTPNEIKKAVGKLDDLC